MRGIRRDTVTQEQTVKANNFANIVRDSKKAPIRPNTGV